MSAVSSYRTSDLSVVVQFVRMKAKRGSTSNNRKKEKNRKEKKEGEKEERKERKERKENSTHRPYLLLVSFCPLLFPVIL